MMGIKGSGMSGIAKLASLMGYKVTGCDLKLNGHNEGHLKNVDYLIVSPAVFYQNKKHKELQQAIKRNIVMTWQEFLGKFLMKDKKVIAVAGTHGKSTTTAMIAKILIDAGFDPSVVVGAYVPAWKGNSRFGKGEWFVVEADEFNNNFLNYHPDILVINNIEFDHPDFFKSEKEVIQSFKKFEKNLKHGGTIIRSDFLVSGSDKTRSDKTESLQKRHRLQFNLKVLGEHNQKNANMAYLVGRQLKIKREKIIKSLENFKGIGRRMELIGAAKGIKIYDDYAHHPTAIKITLEGLRQKYPLKKILAIIEPHGYKRTKALLPLYKNVFDVVDSVIIGPIFKARDKIDNSISLKKIAKISAHKNIKVFKSVSELISDLKFQILNYPVVVVMGAGESNLWAKQILQLLKN